MIPEWHPFGGRYPIVPYHAFGRGFSNESMKMVTVLNVNQALAFCTHNLTALSEFKVTPPPPLFFWDVSVLNRIWILGVRIQFQN